jgi:hypothetical protein
MLTEAMTIAAQTPDFISTLKDIAAIIGPLIGVFALIGVIYQANKARDTGKETVEVSERDVQTKAFTALTEMFTVGLNEVRLELASAKQDAINEKAARGVLETKVSNNLERITLLEDERSELKEHIIVLEGLVPSPPGPPPRPKWLNDRKDS